MWFADFDNTFKKDYVMHVLCPLWKRSASVAYTIVFHSVGLLIEVFVFIIFLSFRSNLPMKVRIALVFLEV